MSERDQMNPLSGEPVESDGIYSNEWGREEELRRGEVFPADPQLGTTAWEMVEITTDERHPVKKDPHSAARHHPFRQDR